MFCQGVPARKIAVSNPGEDLSQLISKLQSSIVAWEKEHPSQGAHTTFTDRCYCNQDQGQNYDRNFSRKEFKQYANTIGINTKGVPVEAHNSVSMVERYYRPLRRAY